MARLFADENFPFPVVEELRRLGHDVTTVQEAGLGEQAVPDDRVLSLASRDERAVLTLNRKDFRHLHKRKPGHRGVVICTFDPDFAGQARRIHEHLEAEANLSHRLLRVNQPPSS